MKRTHSLFKSFSLQIIWLGLVVFVLTACQDTCKTTYTYQTYTPVYKLLDELRNAVKSGNTRELKFPGKIYYKHPYIFVNELNEGVHIIDNSNPSSPHNVGFIEIPGNVDIAVRENILYADSYIDLVAIDISDLGNIREVHRIEGIFTFDYTLLDQKVVTEWKSEWVTTTSEEDCNSSSFPQPIPFFSQDAVFTRGNALASMAASPTSGTLPGVGGSMARFTLYDNYLYAVGPANLQLFSINNPASPQADQNIPLNWGVETIFPYEDKLFIGTNVGMHIMDNSNPSSPTLLSTYAHVQSCDPVVVQEDYAYVTLRSGNECQGFTNQLELIDISDLSNPTLAKVYPMQNPHGLGIDNSLLFICEGEHGLKAFDATDPLAIDQHQLAFFKDHQAYDVIPLGNILLLVGNDGLYQYDYSDPQNIKLLSVIPVTHE